VHAHAIVSAAIDTAPGELVSCRLGPEPASVIHWLRSLPGTVAMTYDAGPTCYALARALQAACISCWVAAPSKIRRASGERVKIYKRDAALLAQLFLAGNFTVVTVPSVSREAARNLVRARDDCRLALMKARHQVSKVPPDTTLGTSGRHRRSSILRGCGGRSSGNWHYSTPLMPILRQCWQYANAVMIWPSPFNARR